MSSFRSPPRVEGFQSFELFFDDFLAPPPRTGNRVREFCRFLAASARVFDTREFRSNGEPQNSSKDARE